MFHHSETLYIPPSSPPSRIGAYESGTHFSHRSFPLPVVEERNGGIRSNPDSSMKLKPLQLSHKLCHCGNGNLQSDVKKDKMEEKESNVPRVISQNENEFGRMRDLLR
ncbi:hypothetical protein TNCV_2640601 [Trichonephila clavipes]|nr:hypothetical protein TNCV_2640601 [Trichonephila clavipes]